MSVLIVDDESPARNRLRRLLDKEPDLGELAEADGGETTIEMLESRSFDVMLLDIQMPEVDGFDVLRSIDSDRLPLLIVVTAHDQFALKAFDAQAIDYLLKPFGDARAHQALARAKQRIREREDQKLWQATAVKALVQTYSTPALDRLAVKVRGRTIIIAVASLELVQAAGVYVYLYTAKEKLLYRSSLVALLRHLRPEQFIRVHRSAIVNVDSIVEVRPAHNGESSILLRSGQTVHVSRSFRRSLERRLGFTVP